MTALHNAVRSRDLDEVRRLLTSMDVNSPDVVSITPLHRAAFNGYLEVAELLVERGAQVDSVEESTGQTPLHYALRFGRSDVAMFLMDSGADIHLRENRGNTALHLACTYCPPVVEAILKRGVDPNCRNSDGETPLETAVTGTRFANVDLLVDYGADVNQSSVPMMNRFMTFPSVNLFEESLSAVLDYGCGNIANGHDDRSDLILALVIYARYPTVIGQYFVKLEVAQLGSFDRRLLPLKWADDEIRTFRNECEMEIEKMKAEKVGGTSISYFSVFYLDPSAYRTLFDSDVSFTWSVDFPRCLTQFPIYGRLLYRRIKIGMQKERRKRVIEECYGFFALLTELPEMLTVCADEIFSYLDDRDLANLAEVCH